MNWERGGWKIEQHKIKGINAFIYLFCQTILHHQRIPEKDTASFLQFSVHKIE